MAFTLETFAQFLERSLSSTAAVLDWSADNDDFDDIVTDTLLHLDIDDIETVTDNATIRKLRAVGQMYVWKMAMAAFAGDYTFSADGGQFSRNQLFQHAETMFQRAESACFALGVIDGYSVEAEIIYDSNSEWRTDPNEVYAT